MWWVGNREGECVESMMRHLRSWLNALLSNKSIATETPVALATVGSQVCIHHTASKLLLEQSLGEQGVVNATQLCCVYVAMGSSLCHGFSAGDNIEYGWHLELWHREEGRNSEPICAWGAYHTDRRQGGELLATFAPRTSTFDPGPWIWSKPGACDTAIYPGDSDLWGALQSETRHQPAKWASQLDFWQRLQSDLGACDFSVWPLQFDVWPWL